MSKTITLLQWHVIITLEINNTVTQLLLKYQASLEFYDNHDWTYVMSWSL